ncbi:MAG: phage baseplate protein [Pyrinomonadaceae bacterium]
MSLVNIFTRKAPTIGGNRTGQTGYSFDAVLEDTLEINVAVTTYPVESGVRVSDHRILQPFKWTMTGAVSNNPLQVQVTDFLGGVVSNFSDSAVIATVAGLSAGFLAGSDETRASTTLAMLIDLMQSGDPFDVDAGDITLTNMVITRLSRTKEPRNENGLEFVVELQELVTLERLVNIGQPGVEQLRTDDPSESAISKTIRKGQQALEDAGEAINNAANEVLDSIF